MIEWGFSILFKVQILKYLTAACFLAELSKFMKLFSPQFVAVQLTATAPCSSCSFNELSRGGGGA